MKLAFCGLEESSTTLFYVPSLYKQFFNDQYLQDVFILKVFLLNPSDELT